MELHACRGRAFPPRHGRMRVVAPVGADPAAVMEEVLNGWVYVEDAANADRSWGWDVRMLCAATSRAGMFTLTMPAAGNEDVPTNYEAVADLPNPQDVVGCASGIWFRCSNNTLKWRVLFVETDADVAVLRKPLQSVGWRFGSRLASESGLTHVRAEPGLKTIAFSGVEYSRETRRYGRVLPVSAFRCVVNGQTQPCTVTGPDAFGVNWVTLAKPEFRLISHSITFYCPDDPDTRCSTTVMYFRDIPAWRPHDVWDAGLRRIWMAACVVLVQGIGNTTAAPISPVIGCVFTDTLRVLIRHTQSHMVVSEYAGMVATFL